MRRFVQRRAFAMAVVLMVLLASLVMPTIAQAIEQTPTTNARVRVFQEYKVSTAGLKNSFDYRIVPQESGSPLPVDDAGNSFSTFTLTRDDDLWLEFPVTAADAGQDGPVTYHYLLEPVTDELSDGLYYVDVPSTSLSKGVNRYYLDINVVAATDGSAPTVVPVVHVEGWDGPKVTDPGWRIAYQKPNDEPKKDEKTDDSVSSGGNARASTTTSTGSTASRQATAKTGDPTHGVVAIVGLACVLLAWSLRLRKAGDDHA